MCVIQVASNVHEHLGFPGQQTTSAMPTKTNNIKQQFVIDHPVDSEHEQLSPPTKM
jgi:hypothetical protein